MPKTFVGDPVYVSSAEDDSAFPTGVLCGRCAEPHERGAIRNGLPYFDTKQNTFTMKRVFVCSECNWSTTWRSR